MRPFPHEPRLRIAPSVLSADFARLAESVAVVEQAGADLLHLDVMDGRFVPNLTFGPLVVKALRPHSNLFFDVHLMIEEPLKYAGPFVQAGSDLLTFHIEVSSEPRRVIEHMRGLGAAVGVSINPGTPVSAIESILGEVDLVLVMSVWPGFAGQTFISDVLDKVRMLSTLLGPHQRLEIDGGMDETTAVSAVEAGADTLVAGSAVWGQAEPAVALARLRSAARSAYRQRGNQTTRQQDAGNDRAESLG